MFYPLPLTILGTENSRPITKVSWEFSGGYKKVVKRKYCKLVKFFVFYKDKLYEHTNSMNRRGDKKGSLSSYIWNLKDRGIQYDLSWQLKDRAKTTQQQKVVDSA